MSSRVPRSIFPTSSCPLQDVTFEGEVPGFQRAASARNDFHISAIPMLPTNFYQLPPGDHLTPGGFPSSPYIWNANQLYTTPTPIHGKQHPLHDFTRRPTDIPMAVGPWFTPPLPSALNWMDVGSMTSDSHSVQAPDLTGFHRADRGAFDPLEVMCLRSSTELPLLPPLEQDSRGFGYHHATRYPSTQNNQYIAESCTNWFHLPSHQLFTPSLPRELVPATSTGHSGPDPPFRLVLPQDSIAPSRRRRGARAIEYHGLWIDEEELIDGMTEPSGKISVLKCCWEEDQAPCNLWITGDKSCIHTHIQKWHGGKPGGDKLEVDCRWSRCAKAMLKESIARHVLGVHLGEVWECQACGKEIARNDAYGRHALKSTFEGCRTAGALVTYSTDVRVIDARTALESGGRLKYPEPVLQHRRTDTSLRHTVST